MTSSDARSTVPPLIKFSLIFSAGYLIYLAVISQMIIFHDAIGYESLGTMLQQKGWQEYFRAGPQREPLYPWIISIAMGLGQAFGTSYQTIQMVIQIFLLFAAQLLTLRLFRKLKTPPAITAAVLLYLVFSPNLINSTFILYSEIAVYPLVLLTVLAAARVWQDLFRDRAGMLPLTTLGLSACFTLLTFSKGIFELITPLFLTPYAALLLLSVIQKRKRLFQNGLVFFAIFLTAYYLPITAYKFTNQKFNGQFTLTDRGAWALYGNTARRMEPLDARRFLAAVIYASGEDVCLSIWDKESCLFWGQRKSDDLGEGKRIELDAELDSPAQVNRTLTNLAAARALSSPLQYGVLAFLEGLKMIFWEGTGSAYVIFPEWLARWHENKIFLNGLKFTMALLTLAGLCFLTRTVWRRRAEIFSPVDATGETAAALFSILIFLTAYISAYAIFFCFARYALPIAPLYLIGIGVMAGEIFRKKSRGTVRREQF